MSSQSINRRHFLETGLLAGLTAGCSGAIGYSRSATNTQATRVRKEVNTLSPTEIADFKNAVQTMKARMATDPKGWRSQALIHTNFCPHGNWFFLPWHRAYLFYFEAICRDALGGESDFALPYWDWTKNQYLPAAFWGPNNPLNDPTREIDPNDPIPPEFAGTNVIDNILGIADFQTFASGKSLVERPNAAPLGFTGQLEGVPHNNIHGLIGGNMGSVPTSAFDPIFWLHHANIDRLWTEWDRRHPGATTTDPDWLTFQVGTFFDLQGNQVKKKVSDLLSTYDLGYRYDTQPAQQQPVVVGTPPPVIADDLVATSQPRAFAASVVRPLSEAVKLSAALTERITEIAKGEKRGKPVRLIIGDLPVPENARIAVRVFLNCKDPTPRTPIGDPTYVGSFAFFGHSAIGGGNHADMGGAKGPLNQSSFCFDISEVVRRLERAGQYQATGDLTVSLVPVPLRRGQSVGTEIKPGLFQFVGLQ
jgi:tyrosinase